ncbi:MAG TPA: DEAD/DEAH box helicase [Kofleriaceae bacterium]|nr:DEAD/DEAH box helicase [Kofleriaceae bacterium]
MTAAEIAAAISNTHPLFADVNRVRLVLDSLWVQRRILQIASETAVPELVDAETAGHDAIGDGATTKLPVEQDDIRGFDGHRWERVAIFPPTEPTRYRSRVAEIARYLSRNHQRFRMLPSTGLLRYERRSQRRPRYSTDLATLRDQLVADIRDGNIRIPVPAAGFETHSLDASVNRDFLARSVEAVLDTLVALLTGRGQAPSLAEFQARSLLMTLAGLYSRAFRRDRDGHIATAGVGSGKSYAFQLGALMHAAYCTLRGTSGIATLLVYPRVVLAANQFQELQSLVEGASVRLGQVIPPAVLDAGGRLGEQAAGAAPVRGQKFHSIRQVYQGATPILISNLDTIANRIAHPEASKGLTGALDLIVLDEVHLMSGLYGAHGRMLLKRILLLRALWRLREQNPTATFEDLLSRSSSAGRPYFLGASATIAEPRQHFARVADSAPERILHLGVEDAEDTGWVHHLFLRQRPEASSMTAVINGTSCLVHNRRDGTYHEYYERAGGGDPLRLDELANPVQPAPIASPRDPKLIHKTLGFCDSLDGVNRWADLLSDNERTKSQSMAASASPVRSIPYFAQFQEPLWRVVLHGDMSQRPPSWRAEAIRHYGKLCRECKSGVSCSIARIPPGLRQAQTEAFDKLWDHADPNNEESYLVQLGVKPQDLGATDFAPVRTASTQTTISNLDGCGFFQSGLCWWWSRDHLGNNRPASITGATPLNGYRRPRPSTANKYHPVNGVRVRSFTSKANLAAGAESINDIFQDAARQILRDRDFGDGEENCALVIGSPSLEVGVDLARVRDGVTFRAMRDPASLQQKVGRVGRELAADSLLVHLVTENARDHFYFRNPRIILDPEYLQPIPLHEDNRIVARNHFFMSILDFLVLQGSGPPVQRPANDGDRLMLVNDHKNTRAFSGWDRKVEAAFDFFFGSHARAGQNLENLRGYLGALGAQPEEMLASGYVDGGATSAPNASPAGAIDVFRHDFGPNFFQTQIVVAGRAMTPATMAAWPNPPPTMAMTNRPRQDEFVRTYHDPQQGIMSRSYASQLLTLPLFRIGIPRLALPGNQPFLWTPNFYESVGRQYVRVFVERNGRQYELGHEPLTTVLGLLGPGTVTYRYDTTPYKVPVGNVTPMFGAAGLDTRQRGLEDVLLDTSDASYFERDTACPSIAPQDLPYDYPDPNQPVPVFRPRQVGLIPSWSEPIPHPDGLLADNDERDLAASPQIPPMATPPRCFALRWYRLTFSTDRRGPIGDRLSSRYRGPSGVALSPATRPPVLRLFTSVEYDAAIDITAFVWGLDRQFMTRRIDPARLVYRSADHQAPGPIVLGHRFQSPGLRFEVDLRTGAPTGVFLDACLQRVDSPVHQALLGHALHDFIAEHARAPLDPSNPPWAEQGRPGTFTVRNIRSIVWFHLLEQWHPPTSSGPPGGPPRVSLDDLIGCFSPGDARYIDAVRFDRICRALAAVQNPANVGDRTDSLRASRPFFEEASARIANLTTAFVRRSAERLLLNSLGIALHNAALRVSGASTDDLTYFYTHRTDAASELVLFDSDEFGNGTADLLRRNFHVSSVERVLVARESALGGQPDPLPTTDFIECAEETLHECPSSHASHLAFHNLPATAGCWRDLDGARLGERQVAGPLFDFVRTSLSISSFDDLVHLQWVPEFVAHAAGYPAHAAAGLQGGTAYPTFQALESAFGFCVDGCITCVVAPEQNLHGVLTAKESVSKLLLDALYREVVCGATDAVAQATYPGMGPSRTVDWTQLASTVASSLGRSPTGVSSFVATLQGATGASDVTVFPATTPGAWSAVFRPTWDAAPTPQPRVRPRMPL